MPSSNDEIYQQGINVRWFGAKGNGTTDDTLAFNEAIIACPQGGILIFPKGTYLGHLNINKPITIYFNGSKIIAANPTDPIIQAKGSNGSNGSNNYTLSVPAERNDKTLTLTNFPTDITAGDLIILRDDTTRVSDQAKDVNLEVHQVLSVKGNNINLKDFVRLPKAISSTTNVYKIIPLENVNIYDVELQAMPGATGNTGIYVEACKDVVLKNVQMTYSIGPCITFRKSYHCLVDGFKFTNPQATGGGQGYGVQGHNGTMGITICNGYTDSMRHTVDCGNCFDVLAHNITGVNSQSSTFVLSHNGWDSDITFTNLKSYGGTSYPFQASSQGVRDLYSLTHYNLKLENCYARIDESPYTVGLYFQAPVKESFVRNLTLYYGKGDGSKSNSEAGIRLPSVDSDLTIENVRINGFKFGILQDTSGTNPNQIQSNAADRVIFRDIEINNGNFGYYGNRIHNLNLENIRLNNISQKVINIINGPQRLRYLTLENLHILKFKPGTLIAITGPENPAGVIGKISSITTDLTTKNSLLIKSNTTLTIDDILTNKNGSIISLYAPSPVILATPPLPRGLVEGQKITIIATGSEITIPVGPNSYINTGNANGNVTIGPKKPTVSLVWINGVWWPI